MYKDSIRSITIHCPELDKDVSISESNFNFEVRTESGGYCETCYYEDNTVVLYITMCECGKPHSIKIDTY